MVRLILCLSPLALVLTGCLSVTPKLVVAEVSSVAVPNRLIEEETMWKDAKPLMLDLRPSGQPNGPVRRVVLRAVHDERAISILAIWHDPTEATEYRRYIWNEASNAYFMREIPTDYLSFKFCIDGDPDACMLSGGTGLYDIWTWKAGWSHVTGFADDLQLLISSTEPSFADGDYKKYPIPGSGAPVYLQWIEDSGIPPYERLSQPLRYDRNSMPVIKYFPSEDSPADVKAEAVYEEEQYKVEFFRLLNTGHDDDYAFTSSGPHLFSIAVANDQSGANHFSSDLIELVFD